MDQFLLVSLFCIVAIILHVSTQHTYFLVVVKTTWMT